MQVLIQPRGDENHLHVSDLFGCDRATHARIVDNDFEPVDANTAFKFRMGNDVEEDVRASFLDQYATGKKIAMWLDWDGIQGQIVPEDYVAAPSEIIGHPDAIADDAVIEIKSVVLYKVMHPPWNYVVPQSEEDLSRWHRIQVAAYALALRKERAVVFEACRASGERKAIEFDPEHLRPWITNRMQEMFNNVALSVDRPEPTLHDFTLDRKGNSWLCKYCRYAGCEQNVNPFVKVREHAGS